MTDIELGRTGWLKTGRDLLQSPWGLVLAIPAAVAVLDPEQFLHVLGTAANALAGTLPYIALAVLLISGLKSTGSTALVARAFEGQETRMIVLAALFGGLAPFCSCEVIPFIAALLAAGVPLSAVMAFWLSSPLIDPPTVLITAAALGWDFAIGKAVAAVALGLFGGFGVRLLARNPVFASPVRNSAPGGCCGSGSGFSNETVLWQFWRERPRVVTFRTELITNATFLLKWLSLAYLIEAVLILYVPAQLIAGIVGGEGFFSIVVGALVGAPAYLNGYAAPALVAGLLEQGMSTGAGMAFMVAGAVSSIPAMVAVWSLVNRQVFAAYLGFGIAGAVLSGAVFAQLVG